MSRFLYYLIFTNMLAIITTPIPRLLLQDAKEGAIASMILGAAAGIAFTWIIVRFFSNHPGMDLPDLLVSYTSDWFRILVTFYFALLWYLAGAITLVMTVFLLITFLTPEMSIYTITASLLVTVYFGVLLKTKSVLFSLEIVFVLMVPFGVLMLLKLFTSDELNWDQIQLSIMHINRLPTFTAFTSTFFMFIGCANLIIFNKYFKEKQRLSPWSLGIVLLFGALMLATSYFFPIGLSGFDRIDQLIFPWISSADAIRMKYGLVERVVFIFMFIFVTIAFMSIIIHWHVAYKLINSVFRPGFLQVNQQNFAPFVLVFLFLAVGTVLVVRMTQYDIYHYSIYYYNTLPVFIAVFFLMMFAVRKGASSS
ncbi:GerAB/ArcD/ProY family transporter [Sporosarcina trichiuri]|uniref:GerAB/ArcD/ProY family transporter n=1 Tax=Sporosarcina trichiuri TaxID=3056445 RepID=UPI0025B5102F|nr:GerAB/ArcD/ProY family transporter [Sporosarcina sp. 0.2-SM1T-5]WJY27396.1 GerAB/ArcD/ProY family transporter [Sporosarcina sp. 0.2-SM1T-5]